MINSSPINESVINGLSAIPVGVIIETNTEAKITYTCVLTGAEDSTTDLTLPISFVSVRYQTAAKSYINISVPNILEYIDSINARSNGTIVITQNNTVNGAVVSSSELVSADFELFTYYLGARSQSGVLEGHGDVVINEPLEYELDKVHLETYNGSVRRIRARRNASIRPGDTVTTDRGSFIVGSIVYSISTGLATMEITEASING